MPMLTLDDLITSARKSGPPAPTTTEIAGGSFVEDLRRMKRLDRLAKISSALKPMEKPLPKFKAEKAKRIAAYEQTSKDLSNWLPAITANRKSDALFLSTTQPGTQAPTFSSKSLARNFSSKNDLEQKMNAILSTEALSSPDNSLQGFTPEAARERQIDLQKLRSFLFFQQKKQKRAAKIKSKAYHRIKKKERESKAANEANQPETSQRALLKAEIARAKVGR